MHIYDIKFLHICMHDDLTDRTTSVSAALEFEIEIARVSIIGKRSHVSLATPEPTDSDVRNLIAPRGRSANGRSTWNKYHEYVN